MKAEKSHQAQQAAQSGKLNMQGLVLASPCFIQQNPSMKTYEIPDPFETFVANKYKNVSGLVYDFFAKEWYLKASCCGEELYAPNKKTMTKIRLYHTRNECLGGY